MSTKKLYPSAPLQPTESVAEGLEKRRNESTASISLKRAQINEYLFRRWKA